MRINFWLCMVLAAGVMAVGCETGGDGDDECLTSTPCVENSDCDSGQHCNTALATPMCQVLYCGQDGSECSEDELCAGRNCDAGICVCEPDCGGLECGLDPLCGTSCGTCDDGYTCEDGECVEGECEPACGANECGLDPVCGTQICGTCDDGETCQSGQCKTGTVAGEMKLVAAGSFWMGCNSAVDDDCQSDESPYHEVTLSAFYIDKTEVTVDEYAECVTSGSCTAPSTDDYYCNWKGSGVGNYPVNCVIWSQAEEYCAWAGKRLPTEAEWEKAARGTDGRKYPWGNEDATCAYAVMDDGSDGCETGSSLPVCSKSPAGDSPYGLCDMAGNVYEWVSDWYDSGYYANSSASNPTGPISGSLRVVRGGGIDLVDGLTVRASARSVYYFPSYTLHFLGFRCARDAL